MCPGEPSRTVREGAGSAHCCPCSIRSCQVLASKKYPVHHVLFCKSLSLFFSFSSPFLFVFRFVSFRFVLFCFVLFCFVLFCFVLFCFVLFCFVLLYLSFDEILDVPIAPTVHIPVTHYPYHNLNTFLPFPTTSIF